MTTKSQLEERVNRLNERLGRDLRLRSHSIGSPGRAYHLDNEDDSHINPRGALAGEMQYFLDGVFAGLRLAKDNPEWLAEWAESRDDVNVAIH